MCLVSRRVWTALKWRLNRPLNGSMRTILPSARISSTGVARGNLAINSPPETCEWRSVAVSRDDEPVSFRFPYRSTAHSLLVCELHCRDVERTGICYGPTFKMLEKGTSDGSQAVLRWFRALMLQNIKIKYMQISANYLQI